MVPRRDGPSNMSSSFQYALTYAFLKGVSYSIFFWLPYYMGANFGWSPSTAATLSTCYDWGGILGSTVCGFASVRYGSIRLITERSGDCFVGSAREEVTDSGLHVGIFSVFAGRICRYDCGHLHVLDIRIIACGHETCTQVVKPYQPLITSPRPNI